MERIDLPDIETIEEILSAGAEVSVAGVFEINGTSRSEAVHLLADNIVFDPSFNRGGDVLSFDKAASEITAVRSGSSLMLAGEDISALIPVGTSGAALAFSDSSDRRITLFKNGVSAFTIAGQLIGNDPIQLTAA